MLTTAASFQQINKDLSRSLERTAEQPQVARESKYYMENIGDIKSVDDFLSDDRLYTYAMKAHGLEDMTYAKAFMRKVLTEGIDDSSAFANQLADTRYRDFAETFNFVRYESATTAFDRTQQDTVDKYVRQTLEKDAGEDNKGVRLALYFERKADSLNSPYEILADPALIQVVQTALGLSSSISATDIDRQAEIIENRLDLDDLKDPEKLDDFLERFTAMWEMNNPSTSTTLPANLLVSGSSTLGIGVDILTTLQNIKIGGR